MFAGQSAVTVCLIATSAAQGVLSSFFYKYADTILKKYSSTIATIFTALLAFVLFHHPLTVNFFIGVSIVLISMHQFFSFGHLTAHKTAGSNPAGGGLGGGLHENHLHPPHHHLDGKVSAFASANESLSAVPRDAYDGMGGVKPLLPR